MRVPYGKQVLLSDLLKQERSPQATAAIVDSQSVKLEFRLNSRKQRKIGDTLEHSSSISRIARTV